MSIKYFLKKIKDVKIEDIFAVFPMIAAIILIPICRKKYEKVWLVCEEPGEARDNGYYFFKYICESHPEIDSYYAIKHNSIDYNRVSELGKTVKHGSIKHWIMYFVGICNVSSQKGGKPNAAICSFIELNHLFHPRNVFLQHGVIKDDLVWLHADRTILDLFVTSSVREQQYVQEKYGYKPEQIIRTGLPRFDDLHNAAIKKNQILVMPTWRTWLRLKSERNSELDSDLIDSDFIHNWLKLLNSSELRYLTDKYNLEIMFYPHRHMQPYVDQFTIDNPNVVIASYENYDIHELIKNSEMLITDYSSVYFDMVYMKKPVVFYQFDEDNFRKFHYQEGYFDYHNNPFGKSFRRYEDVVKNIEEIIKNNYCVSLEYLNEHNYIFPYYDTNNSKRIFDAIQDLYEK